MSNENNDLPTINFSEDNYMSAEQRAYFVALLEDQKTTILSGNQRTKDYLKNERIPTADLSDRATQEEDFAFELRIRNRESRLLYKIDAALARLRDSRYGWCEECGEPIGINRLKARPTSELCILCKEKAERRERCYRS